MALQAMADAGAAPHTTVMIGDTSYDMEMAQNAGVRGLGVNWGYHSVEELTEAGAHAVAVDMNDLARHIAAL
jgi:phosphoglycolate phosphatase